MKKYAITLLLAFLITATTGLAQGGPPYEPGHVLTLVNKENTLHYSYVPDDLVLPMVAAAPGKEEGIYLRPMAASALERLFKGALEDGIVLYAWSGYRSYYDQKRLYQGRVEALGEKQANKVVAKPGASEHQLGLAMDISGESTLKQGLTEEFAGSIEGEWVRKNAHLYGFIIRYPKERTEITGYIWEPWHIRYVGVDAAVQIHAFDITFEEYHEALEAQ